VTRRRVERWGVGLVATLALTAFGLLYGNGTLLAAAAVPLTYVLYGTVSRVPPGDVGVERSFDRPDPRPGETVTVTLTVENTGNRVLPDCRVIDGVPAELAVTDGSPRACVALSPGDTAECSYTVVAKRGQYGFDDPVVRLRSLASTGQLTDAITADGDRTLSCENTVADAPLDDATLPRAGTRPTDSGGSGLEFYATRKYQTGDPMNRIDWRHYAKTGEFVTVQYRRERAIRTVVLVDARRVGRVTARPGYPTGAELCAYAGERLYDALEGAGVATTVTAVGVDGERLDGLVGPDGLPWIETADNGHAGRVRRLFDELQTLADRNTRTEGLDDVGRGRGERGGDGETVPPDRREGVGVSRSTDGGTPRVSDDIRRILARLPPNAQVVVCSPVLDAWPVGLARSLSVRGYPQVVVSPDVTDGESNGQRVLAARRRRHLADLERVGATTVSWSLDQPIDYALRRSLPYLLGGR
jgi:uncharacterized repeat protein (TIGR01451 family)